MVIKAKCFYRRFEILAVFGQFFDELPEFCILYLIGNEMIIDKLY